MAWQRLFPANRGARQGPAAQSRGRLSKAFALAVPHDEALGVRDDVGEIGHRTRPRGSGRQADPGRLAAGEGAGRVRVVVERGAGSVAQENARGRGRDVGWGDPISLAERWIPFWNERFAVAVADPRDAHRPRTARRVQYAQRPRPSRLVWSDPDISNAVRHDAPSADLRAEPSFRYLHLDVACSKPPNHEPNTLICLPRRYTSSSSPQPLVHTAEPRRTK